MGSGQGDGPLEDCTLASVTGAFKQALCHHGTVRSRMGLSATPPPDLRPDRRAADGPDRVAFDAALRSFSIGAYARAAEEFSAFASQFPESPLKAEAVR
ncbi:MAG: hypothetical protein RL721_336, partial [Candidatus Eisenbacteria bacterium]